MLDARSGDGCVQNSVLEQRTLPSGRPASGPIALVFLRPVNAGE
jgi:hypothetical protein